MDIRTELLSRIRTLENDLARERALARACVRIAEGGANWDLTIEGDSSATKTVRELRKRYELALASSGAIEPTASEALFGFCGWLSSRDQVIEIGSTRCATIICDLVTKFIETNKLAEPRRYWTTLLKAPEEP